MSDAASSPPPRDRGQVVSRTQLALKLYNGGAGGANVTRATQLSRTRFRPTLTAASRSANVRTRSGGLIVRSRDPVRPAAAFCRRAAERDPINPEKKLLVSPKRRRNAGTVEAPVRDGY